MKFKLIVFDWDGTLMDSAARIQDCMGATLRELDLRRRAQRNIRELIGLGLTEAIALLLPDLDPAGRLAVAQRYREHYLRPGGTPTPLFPGARQLLEDLVAQGYRLAVATGKGRRGLDRALRESRLDAYIAASRCADETRSKPDPLMLHELMEELDENPGQTLMVGDTEYDIQMAHNAAVAALALTHGVHERERLCQLRPLACLDALAPIPAWLASLNDHGSST